MVAISGADGFIGSYTAACFTEQGETVIAIGKRNKPLRIKPGERLIYEQCDVTDTGKLKSILQKNSCDCFIHLAWIGSAGAERADYNLQIRNAIDTVEIMKCAKECGINRFLSAGSIMEYEIDAALHSQGTRPGIGYIYGIGKYLSHCLCKTVASEIDMEILWPVITNAYGAGEYSPRLINTTLRKIMNGESLEFTAATQNYDFVYVTDVAKAMYLIAKRGKPFHEYLIGSGKAKPLKEFFIELAETVSYAGELKFGAVPFTGVNLPLETFMIDDIVRDCRFEPKVSFESGITKTYEWLKQIKEECGKS